MSSVKPTQPRTPFLYSDDFLTSILSNNKQNCYARKHLLYQSAHFYYPGS